jgi:site-specific recombinase XerD
VIPITKKQLITFLANFELELEEQERSENTIKKYVRYIRLLIDFLEDSDKEITKADMIRFKESVKKDYHPNSQRGIITIVNQFIRYCETQDIYQIKSYHSKLELKQIRQQKTTTNNNVLTASEYKRLERSARLLDMNDTLVIMKVYAYTGIRFGELKYFTVENLRRNTSIIINNKGKYRRIVIPDELKRALNSYINENHIEKGYLFPAPKNPDEPISNQTVWNRLHKLGSHAKVALRKCHPHSLRHMFAKELQSLGESTENIADILGHSSLETTRVYLRKSENEIKTDLNQLRYDRRGRKKR